MSHKHWQKGNILPYRIMRKVIIESLGVSDKRTITKWMGRPKWVWKKELRGQGLYQQYVSEKTFEWEYGALEDLDYIEHLCHKKKWFQYHILKDKNGTVKRFGLRDDIPNDVKDEFKGI